MHKATLELQAPDGTSTLHEMEEGMLSVGSEVGGIRIDDTQVSAAHGRFRLLGMALTYTDLGSHTGSFVANNRVKAPVPLAISSELRLGKSKIVVQNIQASTITRTETTVRMHRSMVGLPFQMDAEAKKEAELQRKQATEDAARKVAAKAIPSDLTAAPTRSDVEDSEEQYMAQGTTVVTRLQPPQQFERVDEVTPQSTSAQLEDGIEEVDAVDEIDSEVARLPVRPAAPPPIPTTSTQAMRFSDFAPSVQPDGQVAATTPQVESLEADVLAMRKARNRMGFLAVGVAACAAFFAIKSGQVQGPVGVEQVVPANIQPSVSKKSDDAEGKATARSKKRAKARKAKRRASARRSSKTRPDASQN